MKDEYKKIKYLAQRLYDKKGLNILAIDVTGVSNMTDFFLIAEGNVERHVQALGREIIEALKELNIPVLKKDGDQTGDWMVVDAGSILVHIFIPELRERYALEEVWKEGQLIDLDIKMVRES